MIHIKPLLRILLLANILVFWTDQVASFLSPPVSFSPWMPHPPSSSFALYEAVSPSSFSKSSNLSLPPRNLKVTGTSNNPIRPDNALVQRFNEWKGLSEAELLRDSTPISDRRSVSLNLAYRRCEYVTQLFSKTFYMGTSLLPQEARKHMCAIYAWCRRTDDIVDSPRALLNRDLLTQDLRTWEERLERIWKDSPVDLFDLALAETVKRYPGMSIEPFKDMIRGMVMDVPGLGKDRYQTFDELYVYCYRVAGTVGLMTLPVFGTCPSHCSSPEDAAEPAIALGIGLQLTNILRDVGEDLERGRIYLPLEELQAFGLTEEDITSCRVTPKYKKFLQFQIARARDYYQIAEEGIRFLHPTARFAVQASLDLYRRILTVIERNDFDNFSKRAFTTKLEKLTILPQSYLKTRSYGKT